MPVSSDVRVDSVLLLALTCVCDQVLSVIVQIALSNFGVASNRPNS
jgi:hypothetical protein